MVVFLLTEIMIFSKITVTFSWSIPKKGDAAGTEDIQEVKYVQERTERPVLALMYDFDCTLSPRDMQEYGFIPEL